MRPGWTTSEVADLRQLGARIDAFDGMANVSGGPGARLRWARARATAFRAEFASTGTPDSIDTCDLVTLPYPTRFGLFRASRAMSPFLSITNRMLVIRWSESDGRRRVLLFEPSDVELGRKTPYFAALSARVPRPLQGLMVTSHGTVMAHLARLGVTPEEVDYLMFDHLHTQDLRRWVGTSVPQEDLGGAVKPLFPNAKVIVQRDELDAMADLHPLQQPWYQPKAFEALRPEVFLPVEGGRVLGPGVGIVATPGHVSGNQTLLLNTSTGIWASSENVIATECLTPEHSRLPGVAAWAREWGQEVILNAISLESTVEQYNSVILEKALVDRSQSDERFLQFFPSSELTEAWTNPGTSPTFSHLAIHHRR
ncbi:hypothetical protein [Myxococcus landrumensis]|uniref:Metallo-beta-lactamase domain-containing protein n=1 Tax=Myxococcus landrumensis TaxID=2813577 RepID=A0ABX7NIM5_9BACT|nr:hypothetical protein [Myxococcus landrumus]QSQ17407.1 hypothetical protein JY572_15735 [Myxococcus landrumus]